MFLFCCKSKFFLIFDESDFQIPICKTRKRPYWLPQQAIRPRQTHWLPAYKSEMSNSVTDERAMAWIAWGLTPVPDAPDPTEIIRVVRVPFGELLREIGTGAIRDMFTLATALRAYHMAREGELPPELAKAMLAGV